MDEIISYKMCAVKVRNAKLRNYLKALFHSSQNQVGFYDERKRAFIAARKLNYVYFKNSLIIYEEKTKETTAVSVVLYVNKKSCSFT